MDFKRIQEQEMKTKEDFLLDVRAAIKRNQVVVMMLYNSEKQNFSLFSIVFQNLLLLLQSL